jgi:hypothetical protein
LTGIAEARIVSAPTRRANDAPGLATTHLLGSRHDRINPIKKTERRTALAGKAMQPQSKTLSRRSALTAGAAALVAGTAANATAKSAETQDAKLMALDRQLTAASEAVLAVSRRNDERQEAYEARAVARPQALKPLPSDRRKIGLEPPRAHHGCYSEYEVNALRNLEAEREACERVEIVFNGKFEKVIRDVMRPNDLARAAEIIKAHDEWKRSTRLSCEKLNTIVASTTRPKQVQQCPISSGNHADRGDHAPRVSGKSSRGVALLGSARA